MLTSSTINVPVFDILPKTFEERVDWAAVHKKPYIFPHHAKLPEWIQWIVSHPFPGDASRDLIAGIQQFYENAYNGYKLEKEFIPKKEGHMHVKLEELEDGTFQETCPKVAEELTGSLPTKVKLEPSGTDFPNTNKPSCPSGLQSGVENVDWREFHNVPVDLAAEITELWKTQKQILQQVRSTNNRLDALFEVGPRPETEFDSPTQLLGNGQFVENFESISPRDVYVNRDGSLTWIPRGVQRQERNLTTADFRNIAIEELRTSVAYRDRTRRDVRRARRMDIMA